jgi:excisionase family DNA binding protein
LLLSVRAASKLLKVDYRTLTREIVAGSCPAVKIGRRFRIDDRLLNRWLAGESFQRQQPVTRG